ncbi:uncharacterized protein J3R85_014823 [Psidium guajava]|nr:uncharacterized protein J3R85_014823 [Psidium guajava]
MKWKEVKGCDTAELQKNKIDHEQDFVLLKATSREAHTQNLRGRLMLRLQQITADSLGKKSAGAHARTHTSQW